MAMAMGARSLGLLEGFGGGNSISVARDRKRRNLGGYGRAESLPASAGREDFDHASSCLQNHTVHLEADHRPDRIEELKQGARKALSNGQDLNLVDTLQHLGIGYHFEEEIGVLLRRSYAADTNCDEDDLFRTALRFKLLRQGGYDITQDVLRKFVDREGTFKEDLRNNDMFGLLSLHEASYLGARGEELLTQARMFSKQQLVHKLKSAVLEPSIARELGLALDFPRQRLMERFAAKTYIEKLHSNLYCRSSGLLELATLDYNRVQRLYQTEIRELESWWRDIGLAKKLSFARDRPLECFLWTVGMFPEPCFSMCRLGVAKAVAILLVIDDIYDVYGTPEELVLFTDAIRRWDVDAMEKLPEYMKIGYMAIYNTTNEIALKVLTGHGLYAIPQLRRTWMDICEAFLLESNWFRRKGAAAAAPSLDDYIRNGITTAGTYMALVHAFFLMGKQVTKENLGVIDSCPELFTNSGRILRLWDDLGTSKAEQERGDNASSISCYRRNNTSSSEEDARSHVRLLVDESWRDLVKESLSATSLPNSIIKAAMNLARTSQAIYQHGDDDKAPSVDDCIEYLLKKPIHHGYSTKSSNAVAPTLGLRNPKNHDNFTYI